MQAKRLKAKTRRDNPKYLISMSGLPRRFIISPTPHNTASRNDVLTEATFF